MKYHSSRTIDIEIRKKGNCLTKSHCYYERRYKKAKTNSYQTIHPNHYSIGRNKSPEEKNLFGYFR